MAKRMISLSISSKGRTSPDAVSIESRPLVGIGEIGISLPDTIADADGWIVGETIARAARPLELKWPPRGARRDPGAPVAAATLVLSVDGAFALEAQHNAAVILARVNAHLGYRCVERLAFRQGPLPPLRKPDGTPTRFALTARAWGEPVPRTAAAARASACSTSRTS